jgi:hypothetical protein
VIEGGDTKDAGHKDKGGFKTGLSTHEMGLRAQLVGSAGVAKECGAVDDADVE